MPEQQQKEARNLQSCKRLQALASYREQEDELFEAISVLNDALFYLNPKGFPTPNHNAIQAAQLKIEIWIKQVQLCIGLHKPQKAISCMLQLMKTQGNKIKIQELKDKLISQGVKVEQLQVGLLCQ